MRNISKAFSLAFSAAAIIMTGCSGGKVNEKKEQEVVTSPAPVIGEETLLLLNYLEENGDYVNSQFYPSLIKASVVNEEMGEKNLVIDIRDRGSFAAGHINGAVNRQLSELPDYFETGIKPFEYGRIILVCEDGQLSAYTTSLLRLMGYGNVFAMRWGMAGWNNDIARNTWLKAVSGSFESDLDTVTYEPPVASEMPGLGTGLSTGGEIADARFRKMFAEGTANVLITAAEVFSDPGKYYVINLERKDKYQDGHIPGAVRYKPESTLGFPGVMATIPAGRTVVVYCGTGHNSAFATAFLRLFGYDARTLRYGNSSFMYDRMVAKKATLSWLPFTLAESNNFTVVK